MASDTVCCPPQAPRPKVAHPVAQKSGYEPSGTYEKVGDFGKVYVVSPVEGGLTRDWAREGGPCGCGHL
jgi:hypothetical protein